MLSSTYSISNHLFSALESGNFDKFAQKIFEDYYLQPFSSNLDSKFKKSLYDGIIERETHGAMHAGRVCIYTEAIHDIFGELFPRFTEKAINDISLETQLTENQIIILFRFSALFHDAVRQDEYQDRWEKESGECCKAFLIKHGISEKIASIFAYASVYKDSPEKFKEYLLSIGITKERANSFQYIRKLIYLADCLDVMRCVETFEAIRIIFAFKDVPEYKTEHENKILELVINVHLLIHSQQDMLYECDIELPNGARLKRKYSGEYSLSHKVNYEHSSKIFQKLIQSILQIRYFKKHLPEHNTLQLVQEEKEIKPNNNFYIHGTNSSILAFLPKTQFKIIGPIVMLEEYGLAPLSGEIIQGGLENAGTRCNTRFARLYGGGRYTLEKVIDYTRFTHKNTNGSYYPDKKLLLSDITTAVIFLARKKQLGETPEIKLEELREDVNSVKQLFYLFAMLETYICPNWEFIEDQTPEGQNDIYDAILTFLSTEKMLTKIQELKSDLAFTNCSPPTNENLRKAMELLQFPEEERVIKSRINGKPKTATLPRQIFTLKPLTPKSKEKYNYTAGRSCLKDIVKNTPGYTFDLLLQLFAQQETEPSFFFSMKNEFISYIAFLEDRFKLLEKIYNKEKSEMVFSENDQKEFINSPFPLILICGNEKSITVSYFLDQEYEEKKPLELGKDITAMATNSEEHRKILNNFLQKHNLQNVTVYLFDDLKKLRQAYYDRLEYPIQPAKTEPIKTTTAEIQLPNIITGPTTQVTNKLVKTTYPQQKYKPNGAFYYRPKSDSGQNTNQQPTTTATAEASNLKPFPM